MLKLSLNADKLRALTVKLREAGSKPIDRDTAKLIGTTTIKLMRELIASGNSPIYGKGKFPKYKDPKRYPGKKKSHEPVNLYLSGDFLKSLDYKLIPDKIGFKTKVGYFEDDQLVKEQGHRKGTNKQPKRPTIPKGKEEYVKAIRSAVVEIYQKRINKLLKG